MIYTLWKQTSEMNCDLELPQVLPSETFYDTVCEEFMYVNWYLVILRSYTIMVIKESTQLVSKSAGNTCRTIVWWEYIKIRHVNRNIERERKANRNKNVC